MIQGGSRFSMDIPPFVIAGKEPTRYCGITSYFTKLMAKYRSADYSVIINLYFTSKFGRVSNNAIVA